MYYSQLPGWCKKHRQNTKSIPIHHYKDFVSQIVDLQTLPPIIHVAGTNGKGSTVEFLRLIFESAGYKVNAYTSPHLVEVNERIYLSGESIKDDELLSLLSQIDNFSKKLDIELSFFHIMTAVAFIAFANHQADVILLETGMGGRLDPTNIIDDPLLTMITPISYDHQKFLGNTLLQIAAEKSGIIKQNRTCSISAQKSGVSSFLRKQCEIKENKVTLLGVNYNTLINEDKFSLKGLGLDDVDFIYPYKMPEYQITNLANVIAGIRIIDNQEPTDQLLISNPFRISFKNIFDAINRFSFHGRMQKIILDKTKQEIILDGAHNIDAIEQLVEYFTKNNQESLTVIFSVNSKSKIKDVYTRLKNLSEDLNFTSEDFGILSEARGIMGKRVNFYQNLQQVIEDKRDSKRILITGSLYLVGDALRVLQKS